jgi:hypothetical protein
MPPSASQAGLSQLDTTSSADESVSVQSAAAAGTNGPTALHGPSSGSSSPDRRLSDPPAHAANNSYGNGSASSITLQAPLFSAATPSPRPIWQQNSVPGASSAAPESAASATKDVPHVLGTVFEASDSKEIRESVAGGTSRLSGELPMRMLEPHASVAAATGGAGSAQELLVAASPRMRDAPTAAEDFAAAPAHDAVSEEELEAAGRPRPLGAILSEMTGSGLPEGAGWELGALEEPSEEPAEDAGPLSAAGGVASMRSRAVSASTSASIQLPGFPAPSAVRVVAPRRSLEGTASQGNSGLG